MIIFNCYVISTYLVLDCIFWCLDYYNVNKLKRFHIFSVKVFASLEDKEDGFAAIHLKETECQIANVINLTSHREKRNVYHLTAVSAMKLIQILLELMVYDTH